MPASPAAASPPEPVSPATRPEPRNDLAGLAGVAWIAAAAATAFLAFLQWEAARTFAAVGLADEGFGGYAITNAVSAVLTAYFGARCLRGPSRGFLGTSAAFGALNVGWGVIQVSNGATHWLSYATIIAAALAGILSFAARDAAPTPPRAD